MTKTTPPGINNPVILRSDKNSRLDSDELDSNMENFMRWQRDYDPVAGWTFVRNTVVFDDGWLMISNKTTTERAAPVSSGANEYYYDFLGVAPTWATQTAANVSGLIVGTRYIPPSAIRLSGFRYWIPATANVTLSVWIVEEPNGVPRITELLPRITPATLGQWVEIAANRVLYEEFDLVAVLQPAGGELTLTAPWDYQSAIGDPASGQIVHQQNNIAQLRIHEIDNNSVSQAAVLDLLVPGNTIAHDTDGLSWEITSISKTGQVYTVGVTPAARYTIGVGNFTFTYQSPANIDYVRDDGYFTGNAQASGFEDPDYPPAATNDHGYGLDAKFETFTFSPDWDVMIPASG